MVPRIQMVRPRKSSNALSCGFMDAPSVIGCTTRFINNVPCGTFGGKLETQAGKGRILRGTASQVAERSLNAVIPSEARDPSRFKYTQKEGSSSLRSSE